MYYSGIAVKLILSVSDIYVLGGMYLVGFIPCVSNSTA